jgi:hypothetical protein
VLAPDSKKVRLLFKQTSSVTSLADYNRYILPSRVTNSTELGVAGNEWSKLNRALRIVQLHLMTPGFNPSFLHNGCINAKRKSSNELPNRGKIGRCRTLGSKDLLFSKGGSHRLRNDEHKVKLFSRVQGCDLCHNLYSLDWVNGSDAVLQCVILRQSIDSGEVRRQGHVVLVLR